VIPIDSDGLLEARPITVDETDVAPGASAPARETALQTIGSTEACSPTSDDVGETNCRMVLSQRFGMLQ
jgi:hypothetical protein